MGSQKMEKRLVLLNQLAELTTMNRFIDDLAVQWDLSDALAMTLNLVVEEAFTNIVQYAFDDDHPHEIELLVSKEDHTLRLLLQDDGIAYDPTGREDPDTGLSVEEREIGGLGVFLIKQMMDHVTYERVGDKNRLIMEKQI